MVSIANLEKSLLKDLEIEIKDKQSFSYQDISRLYDVDMETAHSTIKDFYLNYKSEYKMIFDAYKIHDYLLLSKLIHDLLGTAGYVGGEKIEFICIKLLECLDPIHELKLEVYIHALHLELNSWSKEVNKFLFKK